MNTRIPTDNDPTDEALARAWCAGDRKAGAAFFMRYHDSLCRFFIYRISIDHSEDLVHETFLGFRSGFETFRGEATVRSFLYSIARCKLNDYWRRHYRDLDKFDPAHTSVIELRPELRTTPTQKIAKRQQDQLLLRALQSLPIDTQIIIELYYWERLKVREIADVVQKKPNNVKQLLHRGRKRLEALLEQLSDSEQALEASLTSLSRWAARVREEVDHQDDD